MGKKELKLLQEETDTTLQLIYKRGQYYADATVKIREVFSAYFFNPKITDKLTESPAIGQDMFNFNEVVDAMKICLLSEEELAKKAEAMDTDSTPSLVMAFDMQIAASGLPLQWNNGYVFSREKPYTSKAQLFMQQFAYALSLYRVCLSVCDAYLLLINHNCLNLQEHNEELNRAEFLAEQLTKPENSTSVIPFWQQAKNIKHKLEELTAKIDSFSKDFKQQVDTQTQNLTYAFAQGAMLLEESCKQFPNTTWFFCDEWQAMMSKTVAKLLFSNKCSLSFAGNLTVSGECNDLKKEIAEFREVIVEKMPILKSELLLKAYKVINECLSCLKIEASRKNVVLPKPSADGFFSKKNYSYWGTLLTSGMKANASEDSQEFSSATIYT
ncbi:hypothetical protein [Legionella cardiaca]|uniref:Coiled-coil protein n=1 Tax=Legionella cardiaca TaxID=1071983 RepID=A0ABY8AQ01_9GAMM|nr:hypothetical protein [Legionella cardiaca]WED42783.1 hypothetical protein PXX05_12900 [Legionella cardiaca]